jgi:drug/metabolite transporter (DMT)-like permease
MTSDEIKTKTVIQESYSFRGFLLLVFAVLFWGTSAPIGKYLIVSRFDTLILAQTRTSLTFILLLVFFLIRDRSIFRIDIKDLWKLIIVGVIGIALTNYTYYFTAKEASVATAIIVQYTAPVWVVLYSVFVIKEDKIDLITMLSLAFALIGCYVAVTGGSIQGLNLKGWAIITGPVSAFTFAFQILAMKQLLKHYSVWTVLVYVFGFSALFWLCVNPPWEIIAKSYSLNDWGILWVFAIISILIPQTAFAFGLRRLNAATVGIIGILEPVIAIVAAFLILGESLGVVQIFGALIVIAAVGILQAHPVILRKMVKVE